MMSLLLQAAKKGWTALHFAAFLIDLEAIRILLGSNCDASVLTEVIMATDVIMQTVHIFDEVIVPKQTTNKTAAVFQPFHCPVV